MRHSTIDFEALRYLLAAAETGALSRAAKLLGIDTGSLSKRIQRVEDELGLAVFERGHEGVRPTVGGEVILVHARRVIAEFGTLMAASKQNARGSVGRIRVGTRLPSVGQPLQSMLSSWRKQFPEVRLSVSELNERDILTGLEERRLDVALVTQHTLWPHAAWQPLYHERLLVALPKDHILAHRRTVSWDLLREESLLVQGWDDSGRRVPFLKRFTVFNVAQCDGLPFDYTVQQKPVSQALPIPAAEALVAATGANFNRTDTKAYYHIGTDTVHTPPQESFFEPINFYRTALHELTHWSGAKHRLNRDFTGRFGSTAYAREELVAEIGSAFLCAALGIVPTVRHADYIGNWLEVLKNDSRAIVSAASHASKASDFLLAFTEAQDAEKAA